MTDLEKVIIEIVETSQGCKATELVSDERLLPFVQEGHDLIKAIVNLIFKGELTEIEYILPSMDYRIKSFLLPKGSKVNLGSPFE